ncbi:hypothetical protein HDU98_008415 [Podochytrium sp. JEL0797]|nr:hypothetical protein HDU98_008415 [Podochytrium sp. JEL0797]
MGEYPYVGDEQTAINWSGTEYFGTGGSICSSDDVAVLDYWPSMDLSNPCQASKCTLDQDSTSISTVCPNVTADDLRYTTSQLFGTNVTYAQLKFWYQSTCGEMFAMTHYKVNTCVASSSSDDNSNSFEVVYGVDGNVTSMWNRRYQDNLCKVENKSASFQYIMTDKGTCKAQFTNSSSYYSVDILTTVYVPPKINETVSTSTNVAAIAGGSCGAILLAAACILDAPFLINMDQTPAPVPIPPFKHSPTLNDSTAFVNEKSGVPLASIFDNLVMNAVRIPPAVLSERALLVDWKLPVNPEEWNVEDVGRWLEKNGAGAESLTVAKEQEIDGLALLSTDPVQLAEVLQIKIVGRQAKLTSALIRLKQMGQSAGNTASGQAAGGTSGGVESFPPSYEF